MNFKQAKNTILFLSFILLCNCNLNKDKSIIAKEKKSTEIIGIDNQLSKIIINYLRKNPINLKLDTNEYSLESYYIGFLPIKKDTLLVVFKQPFLMDKVFPERAFRNDYNNSFLHKYLREIKMIGTTNYQNNIITIFDVNGSGSLLYTINSLKKEIPKEILYKTPVQNEIWHPKQYPVWKYKIVKKDLVLISKGVK